MNGTTGGLVLRAFGKAPINEGRAWTTSIYVIVQKHSFCAWENYGPFSAKTPFATAKPDTPSLTVMFGTS